MLSRRTKTFLHTKPDLLRPQPVDDNDVHNDILARRATAKFQYDKRARQSDHVTIPVGSVVYAKPPPQARGSPWKRGIVTEQDGRSYTVQTPNHTIRRNRVHLSVPADQQPPTLACPLTSVTPPPQTAPDSQATSSHHASGIRVAPEVTSLSTPLPPPSSVESRVSPEVLSRSGRLIKPPKRLDLLYTCLCTMDLCLYMLLYT